MTRTPYFAALFIASVFVVACSDDAEVSTGSGGNGGAGASSGAGAGSATTPLWWEDVAPIVYDNCVGCHVEGGIAPLQLISYEEVRPVAELMKTETESRTMPPWPADNSGDCQTYRDARWLSDDDIATIGAWVEAGMPEGDPANAPALPGPVDGLEEVTTTLDIGVDYEPTGDLDDEYRCFLVDAELTEDMYLTAHHVRPGDPRVVHHVILYSLESAEAQQEAEQLDANEAGAGYTCFGGARVSGSTFIAGWAPGTPPTTYPEGTGIPLAAGRKAVLQIHYNTLNGVWSDRTTMDITLKSSVSRAAQIVPVPNYGLSLPPGQEYVETSAEQDNPSPVPVLIHGSFPHMHELGVDLKVMLERDGDDVCVMDVPRWDFNWQQFYFYESPIALMPSDRISIACGYDTRGRTDTTTWGEGTQDEMCLNFVYVTLP